jgi:hypothetical protein
MSYGDHVMSEVWKSVPSQPEISASSLGRVLVAPHKITMPNGGTRWYRPEPTYGYEEKTATGRPDVRKRRILRVSRLKKTFKIARLVCEAFHGPPPPGKPVTIHIDEDPSNNRPENLRWGTQKENLNMPKYLAWRSSVVGDLHPAVKYSDATIAEIRQRHKNGERQADLARKYEMSTGRISDIVNMRCRPSEWRA